MKRMEEKVWLTLRELIRHHDLEKGQSHQNGILCVGAYHSGFSRRKVCDRCSTLAIVLHARAAGMKDV